jgi:Uma2 family endonuclease
MSAATQLPHLMTVAEFLAWETPDGSDRWELIEGTPEAMAPASDRHGRILAEAARLLGNHLAETRPDCRVVVEGGLRPSEFNVRIPELAVTCGPRDPNEHLTRDPVLVVEILSPSNWRRTWANVSMYQAIASIEEILVLESDEIKAALLRRAPAAPWPQIELTQGDTVILASIGCAGPLAAFYRTV